MLFSGLVLAAFGLAAWGLVCRVSLLRVDDDILQRAQSHLAAGWVSGLRPPRQWRGLQHAFDAEYGGDVASSTLVLAKAPGGEVIYESKNWPRSLNPDRFPAPNPALAVIRWRPPPGLRPPRLRRLGPRRRRIMMEERTAGAAGAQQASGQATPASGPAGLSHPPGQTGPAVGSAGQPEPPGRANPPDQPGPPPPPGGPQPPGGLQFGAGEPLPPPRQPMPLEPARFMTLWAAGHPWRFGVVSNGQLSIAMGCDLDTFAPEIRDTLNAFLAAFPLALLLIGGAGWLVSGRALRPVGRLADTAERVTATGLDQRLQSRDDDAEFARLITVFNEMMDRLEKSFRQAVRFSADAAHELRTPLTILQGELEASMQAADRGSEDQRRASEMLEEVHRLKAIVRNLLLLSMADAGQLKPTMEPHDLSASVEEAAEDAAVLAPALRVETAIEPALWVQADGDLLTQVLRNLVSNAVKYNLRGGYVRMELARAADTVALRVSNPGPGIPPEDRDRVFDRFYRGDRAHGRKTDGVGLGLSLSREIARAHGGDLVLDDAAEGETTFLLTLPAGEAPK